MRNNVSMANAEVRLSDGFSGPERFLLSGKRDGSGGSHKPKASPPVVGGIPPITLLGQRRATALQSLSYVQGHRRASKTCRAGFDTLVGCDTT